MPITEHRPLAVYYEHPEWFRPLFQELDRRGLPYVRLQADGHQHDPSSRAPAFALVLNRMSPSAYLRGHGSAVFYTLQFLAHVERWGTRVINGSAAYRFEISKAAQLSLLASLGLPFPRARVIHDASRALVAAEGLRYPVVVKPNVGGSGAGIRRFDSAGELATAASARTLDLGLDGTALVQELIPPEDGVITRVEVLDGKLLYAIRVHATAGLFNLCPADLCVSGSGEPLRGDAGQAAAPRRSVTVEAYTPPRHIVAAVQQLIRAASIDVGGVEYIVDARDGRHYFYDINVLSNFVTDARRVVGFDPYVELVDYLQRMAT